MSRPEVTLQNAANWIPWYENHGQNRVFARFGHAAMARYYDVNISADDDVAVPQAITEARGPNSRFVYYSNHLTDRDPQIVLAITQVYEPLNFLRGNTFIQSKPEVFDESTPQHWLRRRAVDELGAFPAVRKDDLRHLGTEVTPELIEMQERYTDLSNMAQVRKHINGANEAVFGEGRRNTVDFRKVQRLKEGTIRKLISVVEHGLDVFIIPVGMWLGDGPLPDKKQTLPRERSPYAHVGMPLPIETSSAESLISMLHPILQRCVDKAADEAGDTEPLASAA